MSVWRWVALSGVQALLGGVAGWLWGPWAALAGVLLATWAWLLWDAWQLMRLRRWLLQSDLVRQPALHGAWASLATAIRRAFRTKEQAAVAADQRVQDILAALQASPNGLVLLDAAGHIEWCNQMAERHFGFDAQRDMQQTIGNLVRDPAFSSYWASQDFSYSVVMAGRESLPSRPVMLSVHIYPYGDGRHLLLARDITALEQAEAMRRDFVANVSHEIRTPLTVLVGFVETLQTLDLAADERKHYLSLMAQQSGRMQNLVQDLLALSRLEGSPLPGYSDWVSVASMLRQCAVEAQALSKLLGKGAHAGHVITFPDVDAPGMNLEIAGTQAELISAFSNLISNALRYTPLGGTVQVRWEVLGDGGACFSVKDSGPGIDPAHIGRLTERFYRVDRSRSRDTGGTGLGLAIVKHALQRHGAKLDIQSQLGAGATFSAVFPAHRLRMASSTTLSVQK
jgi:two-component system, OmpR family, phosphate regulon sensor histidine kinase PhoR